MVSQFLIKKYENATDKLIFYCFTLIKLNRWFDKGWLSRERLIEDWILLNALYLPIHRFHREDDFKNPRKEHLKVLALECAIS